MFVYCVGFYHDMTSLSNQAMRYMKTFDDAVDVQQILVLAKSSPYSKSVL